MLKLETSKSVDLFGWKFKFHWLKTNEVTATHHKKILTYSGDKWVKLFKNRPSKIRDKFLEYLDPNIPE